MAHNAAPTSLYFPTVSPAFVWLAALACCVLPFAAAEVCADDVDVSAAEERVLRKATDKVASSVVRIETIGGLEKVGKLLVGDGPTTGLIVDSEGYILSSAINFVQMPTSILVTLPSGKATAAKIIAHDRARMLVLLKIQTDEKLTPATLVARSKLTVGQWAVAVGRAYDAEAPNMSVGIVSAVDRIWGKAIQTDAKISPANYGGPLVNIHGEVIGILAPMSPQGGDAVAGAEWYESGIGFAVPVDEVMKRFDTLKAGEDLRPGLLGIAMPRGDIYVLPASVTAVPAGSPAAKAGIQKGDKIVEVDGKPIVRQSQLKHAIGGKYAGDTIEVSISRGDDVFKKSIELVAEIKPFQHPFAGVLPLRDGKEGVRVRFVYPDSPAAKAGIESGDEIISLAGEPVVDAGGVQDQISLREPGDEVEFKIDRGGESKTVSVKLSTQPTVVPEELPAAHEPIEEPNAAGGAVGLVDMKLAEEKNECYAYVPESYDQSVPHGLLIWLFSDDEFDKDKLSEQWKAHCEQHDLILLAPRPADAERWQPQEADFIRKTVEEIRKTHNVDRARIVIAGAGAAGAMAYQTAFTQPELVRATAVIDSALPSRSTIFEPGPQRRFAVFSLAFKESKVTPAIAASIKKLQSVKIPVVEQTVEGNVRELNEAELGKLLLWTETLDQI